MRFLLAMIICALFEINFLFEKSVWSGNSRKEKRRSMSRNLIYLFIIILLIILYQMHFFTFDNVSQRVFLRFLSS